MRALALALCVALLLPASAWALDEADFRYTRELRGTGGGYVSFLPDGSLFAHARLGLADLRVLDSDGRQVPWRLIIPRSETRSVKQVELLNAGRQGSVFVGLLDLGPQRVVRNRLELNFQQRGFVGRVTVFGSDDRRNFARLSTTTVYDIRGASDAKSTVAVFPPSDHRYLRLRGARIPLPLAATVYNEPTQPPRKPVRARATMRQRATATVVDLDLGFARRPVDALRFSTSTPRFDREIEISGSNGGPFTPLLGIARILRLGGIVQREIAIEGRHRRLRVRIENGDDEPLRGLTVEPLALERRILLDRGFSAPYRLLYGNSSLGAPAYDFAEAPKGELRPLRAGRLSAERANEAFEPPERSFAARHPRMIQGVLALAALALGIGGFLALRRRT